MVSAKTPMELTTRESGWIRNLMVKVRKHSQICPATLANSWTGKSAALESWIVLMVASIEETLKIIISMGMVYIRGQMVFSTMVNGKKTKNMAKANWNGSMGHANILVSSTTMNAMDKVLTCGNSARSRTAANGEVGSKMAWALSGMTLIILKRRVNGSVAS